MSLAARGSKLSPQRIVLKATKLHVKYNDVSQLTLLILLTRYEEYRKTLPDVTALHCFTAEFVLHTQEPRNRELVWNIKSWLFRKPS